MRNMILYVLASAGAGYLAILYNSEGFLVLFWAAVLLPPFFLCMLWHSRRRLECNLSLSACPKEAGRYRVCLKAANNSSFYLAGIKAKAVLRNLGNKRTCKVKLTGKAGAGERVELAGKTGYLEFGLWQAQCSSLICYDCLGIFRLRKKLGLQVQVMVLPACYETNIKAGIRTKLSLSGGEWYHPQIGGDDPTEILKLREYQEGDRINRIHWKLSARNGRLIVAEMSMPVGCNVVLFLDAQADVMGREESRAYWEVAHTISQGLLEQECFHFMVWYEEKERKLQRRGIRAVEDLAEFWAEILNHRMGRCRFPQEYEQEFKGEAYVSAIRWSQELELYCNEGLQVKIKPGHVKEQLLKLELEV